MTSARYAVIEAMGLQYRVESRSAVTWTNRSTPTAAASATASACSRWTDPRSATPCPSRR